MDRGSEKPFQDKLIEFAKRNFLILGLFSIGLILISVGLIQIFGSSATQIKFEKGQDVSFDGAQDKESLKIKVDVEGEVIKPGVYELLKDSRIQDALISAGGLTPDANRNAINLAAKIADGQKIYVPAVGEAMPAGSGFAGGDSGGLVSVNTAVEAQLDTLPGIGPVTAQKIIDGRPYGSIEELLGRKVVGKATFEKIRELITL